MIDNEQQISAAVKVQFAVKAARKAKIADPADNKITGISVGWIYNTVKDYIYSGRSGHGQ